MANQTEERWKAYELFQERADHYLSDTQQEDVYRYWDNAPPGFEIAIYSLVHSEIQSSHKRLLAVINHAKKRFYELADGLGKEGVCEWCMVAADSGYQLKKILARYTEMENEPTERKA